MSSRSRNDEREAVSFTIGGDNRGAIEALKKVGRQGNKTGSKLVGDLGKATRKIDRDTKRMGQTWEQRLRGMATQAKSAFGTAATAVGPAVIAVGALTAGVVAASVAYKGLADEINGTVDTIGTFAAATGLSTETLSGLRTAASFTNKEFKELVPKDLAKRLFETRAGMGEALIAFDQLGLTTRIMSGELDDANEAFVVIIDELAKVENPATRAALAVKTLGKEGKNMFSAFSDSSSLVEFIGFARDWGVDLGPKAVTASAEWFQATAALDLAFERLRGTVVGQFGPEATSIMEELAVGTIFVGTVVTELDLSLRKLGNATTTMGNALGTGLGGTFFTFSKALLGIGSLALPAATDGLFSFSDALEQAREDAARFREDLAALGTVTKDLGPSFEAMADSTGEATGETVDLAAAYAELNAGAVEVVDTIGGFDNDLLVLSRSLQGAEGQALDLADAFRTAGDAAEDAFRLTRTLTGILQKFSDVRITALRKETDAQAEALQAQNDADLERFDRKTDLLVAEARAREVSSERLTAIERNRLAMRQRLEADATGSLNALRDAAALEEFQQARKAAVAQAAIDSAALGLDTARSLGFPVGLVAGPTVGALSFRATVAAIDSGNPLGDGSFGTPAELLGQEKFAGLFDGEKEKGEVGNFLLDQLLPFRSIRSLAGLFKDPTASFPAGGINAQDHRVIGVQGGEGVISRRGMGVPGVRDLVEALNQGQRSSGGGARVGPQTVMEVGIDDRLGRVRLRRSVRYGKNDTRSR